jgi:hypothetical protein
LAVLILVLVATKALGATATWVFDTGFSRDAVTKHEGSKVWWSTYAGNVDHHVLSSFFFTSDPLPPNTFYNDRFNGAGDFTITDQPSGDTMVVHIPMAVSPSSGTCDTTFTLQGGAAGDGQSFVYTYQVKAPAGDWQVLKRNTPKLSISYTPGAGCTPGTYSFRSRSALPDDPSQRSDWSRRVDVVISP